MVSHDGSAGRAVPGPLTGGGMFTSDRPVGSHKSTTEIDMDILQITDVMVFKTRVSLNFCD